MNLETIDQKTLQFRRNGAGLLENVEYKFNEDGSINWRSMVDPKFLYVNKENFQKRKEEPPTSIVGVEDKDLVIMLKGLQPLAQIRGYSSVSYRPVCASNEYAGVVCKIDWLGNFETNMQPISYEDCAGANTYNTSEMTQTYLLETATNRAFARCVRNFLKIGIVAREELPPPKQKFNNGNTKATPTTILAALMKEKGRLFKEVKEKLIAEGDLEFQDFNSWDDIPGDKAFSLIDRFKNLKESKK